MFSPNDSGVEYPLQFKNYRGDYFICDMAGNNLFRLDVIRESLDDRARVEEWGQAICERFNEYHSNGVNGDSKKDKGMIDGIVNHVVRGMGRPKSI